MTSSSLASSSLSKVLAYLIRVRRVPHVIKAIKVMRAMRVIGLLGVRFQPHAFAVVCRALLVLLAMSMTTMRR
jgi:hypothetical protein